MSRFHSRHLSAYRVVQSRFAGSPAAEVAAERISKLEAAGHAADSPLPASKADPARDERRAAAQLKMAKTLLERNPEKADDYLKKVIELAPDSAAAAEAKQLLNKP